ncbi:hypothetical protein FB567DRAFT_261410 [Paraphoma chrysanthemicola]|uniref:Uncharacterized protein n=1 Tax=Paraphoma chrysanthemicola TaxID=798071 RepID=A0A8K0QQN5_9PLEO|nr:hypothetical protein FB567DRAFT_261410 [Paraphoma chrysanthemicola]
MLQYDVVSMYLEAVVLCNLLLLTHYMARTSSCSVVELTWDTHSHIAVALAVYLSPWMAVRTNSKDMTAPLNQLMCRRSWVQGN